MAVNSVLLDVNVLIALLWPEHEFHVRAQRWFGEHAGQAGWATCPTTQIGFVRVLSNPAFSRRSVSARDALGVLRASLGHPAHHFWTEDIGIAQAVAYLEKKIVGHQQVTDAYLLGLAIHKRGKLASFDEGIRSLLPEGRAPGRLVSL
jgi:toxin-antitoxin system PIN domain toxin